MRRKSHTEDMLYDGNGDRGGGQEEEHEEEEQDEEEEVVEVVEKDQSEEEDKEKCCYCCHSNCHPNFHCNHAIYQHHGPILCLMNLTPNKPVAGLTSEATSKPCLTTCWRRLLLSSSGGQRVQVARNVPDMDTASSRLLDSRSRPKLWKNMDPPSFNLFEFRTGA